MSFCRILIIFHVFTNAGLCDLLCKNPSYLHSEHVKISYVRPLENETVLFKNITLSWMQIDCAESYEVQLSYSSTFTEIIKDYKVTHSELTIPELISHKEIFWRVKPLGMYHLESCFLDYSFFKTSTIVITGQNLLDEIKVFSSNIDGNEILMVDNPALWAYDIKIVDNQNLIYYHHLIKSEKKGIFISDWPKGHYHVELKIENQHPMTNHIMLH